MADIDRVGILGTSDARFSALQNEIPMSLANKSTVSSARSPIPRLGVLIILRSEISSSLLTRTLN